MKIHKSDSSVSEFKVKSTLLDSSVQATNEFRPNGSLVKCTTSNWATAPLPERHPVVKAGDSHASHFWLSFSQWLIAFTVKRRIQACLISFTSAFQNTGLITPPPDRLKYHLVSVISSLCRYKQTMNKYRFHYYFHFPSIWECAVWVLGFFGFSEKQRLHSGLQNYRVWS